MFYTENIFVRIHINAKLVLFTGKFKEDFSSRNEWSVILMRKVDEYLGNLPALRVITELPSDDLHHAYDCYFAPQLLVMHRFTSCAQFHEELVNW